MQIVYKLNKKNHKITFCKKKEVNDISKDLLKLFSDKKMLVVLDKNLKKSFTKYLIDDLKSSNFDITFLKAEGSKSNKNEEFLFKIINTLIKKKFTKKSVIISCGGGVVGDVSALAASLYLRGMIYYHIPTTMTAIVDSCIGGKTGINYKGIINSVGNYCHPENVFISKNLLKTIPEREYLAGLPEIIKYGLINNKQILKLLKLNKEKFLNRDYNFLSKLIKLSLLTKIKFFKDDVYENSTRLNLNFGHTFAHAIEMSLKGKKTDILRHGEAVGLGMLCEIYYFEGKSKKFYTLKNLLEHYQLPTDLSSFRIEKNKFLKKDIFKNIFLDKKKIGRYPRVIRLMNIGRSKVAEMKDNNKIMKTINELILR